MEPLGYKSKNDTIDARGLARMGAERSLPLWKRPSKAYTCCVVCAGSMPHYKLKWPK